MNLKTVVEKCIFLTGKVFSENKNGQKKCPKMKSKNILLKKINSVTIKIFSVSWVFKEFQKCYDNFKIILRKRKKAIFYVAIIGNNLAIKTCKNLHEIFMYIFDTVIHIDKIYVLYLTILKNKLAINGNKNLQKTCKTCKNINKFLLIRKYVIDNT